jgi:ElaB/YqjD/DUF883 family membrane-anchored ribosome-binding protein
MANTKNDTGKSSDKQGGTETSAAGKVSAGTSVGNIGEAPMPHAHDQKSAQGTSTAQGAGAATGSGQGGSQASGQSKGQSSGQSSQQNAQGQGGSTADQVRQRAEEVYERASDWASDAYQGQRRRMNQMGGRSARAFGNARGGVQSYVSENPMVVGLVGLAAGLLLGALLPRTRRENEMFGEWADEVRNQGLRYARDAANRGREYVEETFSGDEAQFSRHESEFGGQPDANRH